MGQDRRSGLRHPIVGGKVDRLWSSGNSICARASDGRIFCAGYLERTRESEPDGKTIKVVYIPREAVALRGAANLSVGGSSVCGVIEGHAVCAGLE